MSGLRVRQIKENLLDLFAKHLKEDDLPREGDARESALLSRCLAAFSVYQMSGCTPEEAASSVWDGADDNGIDAVFFDQSERQVFVIQSKWIHAGSGEPAAAEVGTFVNGVRDLVEDEREHFSKRLQERLANVAEALSQPGTSIHIVLITTGASELAVHGTRHLEKLVKEINGDDGIDESVASYEVLGLSEVYSALASDNNRGKISLDATLLEWSFVATPFPAYFGIIDGYQLKSWWSTHGKRLVAKNIRYALGKTDVNDQILETASNHPDYFWYFNNGITLIADRAARAPAAASSRASGVFNLQDASIVNGAQTVSTIARVEEDTHLGTLKVPVRVILLDGAPDGFGVSVTRTNNLQNRVEGRDFVTQDAQQHRIQQEMRVEGITYEFLRSADASANDSTCELIEVTTALACSSGDPGHFIAVKTGVGRFFNDLSKAPYKALFNQQTTGASAFNAVRVLRAVDGWILKKKGSIGRKSGYSWGVLVHGNRALAALVFKRLGKKSLEVPIREYNAKYESEVEKVCEEIYPKLVDLLEKDNPNKFLAVLFKSPVKGREIFEEL